MVSISAVVMVQPVAPVEGLVMVLVFGIIDTVAEATAPTVGVGASVAVTAPDDVTGGLVPRPVQVVAATAPGMIGIEAEEVVESMEKMASEALATEDNNDAAEC